MWTVASGRVGKGRSPAQSASETFFGGAPPFFGSTSTIYRFGERFRDDPYSLVSLLFAVLQLTVPSVPSHLKKWGARAPVPYGVSDTVGGLQLAFLS